MKNLIRMMMIVGVIFWMGAQPMTVLGQTTTTDVKKKATEAWESFKDYMAHQKEEAIENGKKLLEKADTQIQKLEKDAAKSSGETKAEYEKTVAKLKELHAKASQKLQALADSSADAWNSAKDGLVEAFSELAKAIKEAVTKFK